MGAAPNSIYANGGTALMIHGGADDMKTDPAGNAGDRIVCGDDHQVRLTPVAPILTIVASMCLCGAVLAAVACGESQPSPAPAAQSAPLLRRRPRDTADGPGAIIGTVTFRGTAAGSRGRCRWIRIRNASRNRAPPPSCSSSVQATA